MTQRRDIRTVTLAVVAAVGFLSFNCASTNLPSAEVEVAAVVNQLAATINGADLQGFMDLLSPEATAFLPSAANPFRLTGKAQIRAGVAPALESRPTNPMAVRDLLVTVHGTLAVATFEIGNPIVHSRRTLVLQHTGNGWKILHLHASNLRVENK